MAKKTIKKELTGAQDLYNFLFEACNIIRGPVSQDNFKDYITPLLYYKRISDVYDEETEDALIDSGGDKEYASLPEQHRFIIPDGCHWQDVRERSENLGAAIVGAMRQIEIANPDTLYGVLSRWVLSIPFFISCIRQQNPLTVLSKIILRKVKQFNLPPPKKNEGFLHF